jgi:2-polyprenyl-6-methoxyphenol hydroxylase-like FAD-dependent oxidoreductase
MLTQWRDTLVARGTRVVWLSSTKTVAGMQPQWKTEAILRARLSELGGAVDYGQAFVALEQDDQSVRAIVTGADGPETVEAKYLVAADGRRGKVRGAVGIHLDGETPSPDGLVVAEVHVDGLDRGSLAFLDHDGCGHAGALPACVD